MNTSLMKIHEHSCVESVNISRGGGGPKDNFLVRGWGGGGLRSIFGNFSVELEGKKMNFPGDPLP